MGRDRSLPTTSQSPASASHGSGQRRSAGRRPRQPRPAGMAAGDGGAAALSTRRAGRRGSVLRAPLEPAGTGRGACGGALGRGWGPGGRSRGGGEGKLGRGGIGVPQATVAGRRASGVSGGSLGQQVLSLRVRLAPWGWTASWREEERCFVRPGVVEHLISRGAWKDGKGEE